MMSTASWMPFARATAVGWIPLCKQTLPPLGIDTRRRRCSSRPSDSWTSTPSVGDKTIHINVSGQLFDISVELLHKYPDTLLGSEEKEYFFDEISGEYFFDRDPEIFLHVLGYYRSGVVHYPANECFKMLEDELSFFGLRLPDVIADCCQEEYTDRLKEYNDRFSDVVELDSVKYHTGEESSGTDGNRWKLWMSSLRKKLWNGFENPRTSMTALIFYYVTGFFIAASVLVNIIETIPCEGGVISDDQVTSCGKLMDTVLFCADSACVAIFTGEYLLRLFAAPQRLRYLRSLMSLIDVVAILPFYIGLCNPDNRKMPGAFITLRVCRVFRVFKFSRHSAGLRILGNTLRSCSSELGFLLFSLSMAVVIFATIMYYAEKNVEDTTFTSIPEAFWYTVVTLTTLGYGDMVPHTAVGKIVGGVCSLSGVIVIALPVPVIVSNFGRIYHQNQRSDERKIQKITKAVRIEQNRTAALKSFVRSMKKSQRVLMALQRGFDLRGDLKDDDVFYLRVHHLLMCLEWTTGQKFISRSVILPLPQHPLSKAKASKKTNASENALISEQNSTISFIRLGSERISEKPYSVSTTANPSRKRRFRNGAMSTYGNQNRSSQLPAGPVPQCNKTKCNSKPLYFDKY